MQNHCGVIFSVDGLVNVILRREDLSRIRFHGSGWFLANGMERLEIRVDFLHLQTGDKGKQVEPVRTDIAYSAQRTTQIRFQAPVPIGGQEKPILEVRALQDEKIT